MESQSTRFRSSRTLSRYNFRQVAVAFLVVLGSITGISWIIGSLKHLRWVINNGMPFSDYMYFNFLLIPINVTAMVTPAAVFAVLFVYNRLTSDRELVAMNAAGLSNIRVATAALAFAGMLSVLLAVHLSYPSPLAYREFREIGYNVRNAGLVLNLKEMEFTSVADDLAIYVGKRHSSSEFEDVIVWETEDTLVPLTMLADQAKLVFDHGKAFLVLYDGMQQSYDREEAVISYSSFGQYTFNLEQYVEEQRLSGADKRELLINELWDKTRTETGRSGYRKQANYRLASVLKPFAIVFIALAILISGPLNRRGQIWRLVSAVGVMFIAEAAFAMLVNTSRAAVDATYGIISIAVGLVVVAFWMIARSPPRIGRRGWRFGVRRRAPA